MGSDTLFGLICKDAASFDIGKWDTSKVTNMAKAFDSFTQFNSDISKWDGKEFYFFV
tara:strand:+ start:627 stop:797 length:171 start_codon:yes stop_codon:yes gene_type:complete